MLKNYVIEKELGKGTYGVVYKAKKKSDNNICVIKKLSLLGLNADQKKEVKLESDILKKIKSKYVVQYYESFEEEGNLYIVMEYCESGDLNDYIEKQKKTKTLLHENIIWKFFIKITLGLADIHKINILHRDLKSLNIFLKYGNDIRVGDLGVAKVLKNTFFAKTFIGTPYYLSPEICEDKPYSFASDVWALGCILYELCTYKHPFTAKSQGGLILKILNDNPNPIDNYYSKDLKDIITKIFNKDHKKRPNCYDILKMNCVIEKAKTLGLFDDIKKSFPNIENEAANDKLKLDKINNNKMNQIHVKPIIVTNKNANNNKKRPASNYGILAKGGIKNSNIKFNNINKKKKEYGLNIPIKENKLAIKKVKIQSNKKNNKDIFNQNKVRKKVVVTQKDKKEILFNEAEKFAKKCNFKNLKIVDIPKEKKDNKSTPLIQPEKNINWINTKDINICHNNESSITKDESKIDNTIISHNIYSNENKIDNSKIINNNNNDNNPQLITVTPNNSNYSIDSKRSEITNQNNIDINFQHTKEKEDKKEEKKEDNNNCSIESDIYMTAKRDIYQPKSTQKEEKNSENPKIEEKEIIKNNLGIEGSLPLMKTKEFNELLSDFNATDNKTINDFQIINNNEENKKNDFNIINNNEDINTNNIVNNNIDKNKSMSSEEEAKEDNNYFSDDDKNNDNSEKEEKEEDEKVVVYGDEKEEENVTMDKESIEEEKNNIKKELEILKGKIDYLKKDILKLIGEEKFKYITELNSIVVQDDTKKEEINEKIENFIKDNIREGNEERVYNILSLFILEMQYNRNQEKLNKLL